VDVLAGINGFNETSAIKNILALYQMLEKLCPYHFDAQ
jgi:hypothetical protein